MSVTIVFKDKKYSFSELFYGGQATQNLSHCGSAAEFHQGG